MSDSPELPTIPAGVRHALRDAVHEIGSLRRQVSEARIREQALRDALCAIVHRDCSPMGYSPDVAQAIEQLLAQFPEEPPAFDPDQV